MFKKIMVLLLIFAMMLSTVACGSAEVAPPEEPAAEQESFKIGLITGTVSQNEEEYRAAEAVKKEYGDLIIQTTFPDNFVKEQETFISQVLSMASDPECKAIIISQGIPGTAAAIDKVRELRPDMYFLVVVPGEDPAMIAEKADLILQADEYNMGLSMIEQAKAMGAETFVQYSFPRHMSYPILAARRDLFEENSAALGIAYVDITAPDPAGDAGVPGTQQFIMEDVPRTISQYGENTAVYGTNCAMQEPMIKQVVENGGIYVLPCCPSPYHGFPSALGISIPDDKKSDIPYILDQISAKVEEKGMTGRLATWAVPVNMLIIQGGTDYLIKMLSGETNGDSIDLDALKEALGTRAAQMSGQSGVMDIQMAPFNDLDTGAVMDNFLMLQEEYYTF
jgi:hypothetical protein